AKFPCSIFHLSDKLIKGRKQFVDKVNKTLINQLLDDLLDNKVLNDGEKESILEENRSTADKARCLIDMVKKKGNVASSRMIYHIQTRDPSLYSQMGLSCDQPAPPAAPPAAEPPKEQEWSTTFIPTKEAFWKEKQNNRNVYPADKESMKSRVALLITNIKFNKGLSNRNGAARDEENMEKLLRSLGYEVVKHTNLTEKEIDAAVIEFSKHPNLKATDSVVVVIMSHGKLGAVLGVDWKKEISGDEKPDEFPIDNIFKYLGSARCPALLNKPKIIIIQACRGEDKGSVLVSDGANAAVLSDDVNQPGPSPSVGEEDMEDDCLRYVHKEKDFFPLLSCTPDTVSYRHPDHGALLIQYLVEVINTYAHEDDVQELYRKVMQRFEDLSIGNKRQMPTIDRCSATKRFYFFPGL
ncbi:hypothetical protein L3Q82_018766, partial [Scortum barcoo]